MREALSLVVNGERRSLEVEARTLLVHALRDSLGLTGTHVGCDTSQCGACTVLIDGRSAKSCTVFAVQADGSEVVTIEGLAKGDEVVTAGGMAGKVAEVRENFVKITVADNVDILVQKSAITTVLPKGSLKSA